MPLTITISNPPDGSSIPEFPFEVSGSLTGVTTAVDADLVDMSAISYFTPDDDDSTVNGSDRIPSGDGSANWAFSCWPAPGVSPGDTFYVIVQAAKAGSPDRIVGTRGFVFQPQLPMKKKTTTRTKPKAQKSAKAKPKAQKVATAKNQKSKPKAQPAAKSKTQQPKPKAKKAKS